MVRHKRQRFFYGWVVVAIAVLAVIVAYALRFNFSIFYVAIIEDLGWSRAATASAFSINLVIYAISAPIAGGLADRFGIRKVVSFGAIFLGITLAACSRVGAIWQLYLLVGLTAIGSCVIGNVPHIAVIANWFSRRRGLAIGIVSAGVVSSMLLAPLVQYLISTLGWRATFLVFTAFSIVILAPLAAIFHRQRPKDKGLKVDGNEPNSSISKETISRTRTSDDESALQDWTLARAIKTYRFWGLISACLFLGFYTYTFMVHQFAYLVDVGYTPGVAAQVVAIVGAVAITGALCTFISDRIGREVTFTIGSGVVLIGLISLFFAQNEFHISLPYAYAVAFGFAFGMNISLVFTIGADLFKGKHFGSIHGVVTSCFICGGAIGPWFAGYIFDTTGDYAQIFPLMYFSIFITVLLIWLVAPRKVLARAKADKN